MLPKDYNRPALDKVMVGELIDLVSGIAMGEPTDRAKDILGRVYEYFLGGFAGSDREAARARMRVIVKRLLRKYGYPPDLQDAAVQKVLQQAAALSMDCAA